MSVFALRSFVSGVIEIMVLSLIVGIILSSLKLFSDVSRGAAQAAIPLQQNHHHLIDHNLVSYGSLKDSRSMDTLHER